eukprot:CAMPEP_0172359372 /NCGR_PEP_ID=MMETSP1060-20121228/3580_1 /TAXON_ID=37318 /ORGANISM="Pseudo-nitzschia pungens, Strain cf. cingulata" /LENGTH=97 /DNA_ID=CAMNT_0013080989 /DNA_START=1 /DNA_END=291 /DNA_ORIENTATION=-
MILTSEDVTYPYTCESDSQRQKSDSSNSKSMRWEPAWQQPVPVRASQLCSRFDSAEQTTQTTQTTNSIPFHSVIHDDDPSKHIIVLTSYSSIGHIKP